MFEAVKNQLVLDRWVSRRVGRFVFAVFIAAQQIAVMIMRAASMVEASRSMWENVCRAH